MRPSKWGTGSTFHRFTVIRRAGTAPRKNRHGKPGFVATWLCRCECGNERVYPVSSFSTTRSCGCVPRGGYERQAPDITGQRIGHWDVVRNDGAIGRRSAWICRCRRCGDEKRVSREQLRLGRACDCISSPLASDSPLGGSEALRDQWEAVLSAEGMPSELLRGGSERLMDPRVIDDPWNGFGQSQVSYLPLYKSAGNGLQG